MQFDRLLTHARLATMVPSETPYGTVETGAIGISGDRIAWAGPMDDIPGEAAVTEDMEGRWITPALVDCHTHLVFAGDRSDEYERKLAGEDYAVIAREGGGIRRTVEATRKAGPAELAAGALSRLDAYAQEGVGTVEIKSGYGLTHDSELAQLKAARGVGLPGTIVHGMLVMGQFEAMLRAWRPGLTLHTLQTRFLRPLPVGATIHVEGRIAKVLDERSAIVRLSVRDDEGHAICVGDATVSD